MTSSAHALMQRLPGGQKNWRLWGQRCINLLLITLCSVSVAKIFWAFWPTDYETTASQLQLNNPQQKASSPLNLNIVYNAHLFGRAEITQPKNNDNKPIDAPDTRLNLTLTGIMAASGDKQSRALIKDSSGKQRPYGIGDDLPGNARLSAIHSDRVILERAGRYETLRMEQNQAGSRKNSRQTSTSRNNSAPLPGAGGDLSAATAAKLSEARSNILQDPTKAGQYIRVQPVYNQGQLKGYRVYPGKDRQLFKDVGLRAGELLTSVNGVQLDDPTKALQMLTDLSQASEFNITLERSGQSRALSINLNQ